MYIRDIMNHRMLFLRALCASVVSSKIIISGVSID